MVTSKYYYTKMTEYEGFSKQDLIDRLTALKSERSDIFFQDLEVSLEIFKIEKLLEEKWKLNVKTVESGLIVYG